MPDDTERNKGAVSDAINAAANLADAVPIYEDAMQPVAQETGRALQTVGRAVNAALLPIKGVVWGFEQVEVWVSTKVSKKNGESESR